MVVAHSLHRLQQSLLTRAFSQRITLRRSDHSVIASGARSSVAERMSVSVAARDLSEARAELVVSSRGIRTGRQLALLILTILAGSADLPAREGNRRPYHR